MVRQIHFSKLHGAGNDFIFIEDLNDKLELKPEEVQSMCDRHFGIGADGVIVVKPAQDPTHAGFMHYMNSDGTLAQMCGNGVRCFAKYVVDNGMSANDAREIIVDTRAGSKRISYMLDDEGKLEAATVDMGSPILDPELVPTRLHANAQTALGEAFVKDCPLESPYGTFAFTCVSMGNPHAVTFVDDVESIDVDAVGLYFESCEAFPEKANIEFASIGNKGISMRVYERGCGETLACGTGACATGVAAFLTGRAGKENDLLLRGGTLHIEYQPGQTVLMTGPASLSFEGCYSL